MNKLAEQLSNDIAIRAAQKLAVLNGEMEKDAGMSDMAKRMLSGGGIGAGIGALGGLANAYMSSDDENPAGLGDYFTNALAGAGIGGGIGAGAGGLMSYLGKNAPAAKPIMDPSRAPNYNPAGAAADALAKSRKPFDGLGDTMSEFHNNLKGFRDTLEGKDLASESARAYAKMRGLFGFTPRDYRDAQLDLVNNAKGLSSSLFNNIYDDLVKRLPEWLGGQR